MRQCLIWLCVIGIGLCAAVARAQADDAAVPQCADVSFLIAQNKTPYDFALGGGSLDSGAASSTLGSGAYADFWSFQSAGGTIDITFGDLSGPALEFTLYNAMYPLADYRPITPDETVSFTGAGGAYTLVVRRVHISDQTGAAYSVRVNAPSLQPFITSEVLQSNGKPYAAQPARGNGILTLDISGIDYRFHPGAITKINEQRRDGSQVYFPNEDFSNQAAYTLYTGGWTKHIALLGGDLAINNQTDRVFFLQNFAFQGRLDSNPGILQLNNLTFPDGTKLKIDSPDLSGLWITNTCTGFKLKDGRSFVAATGQQDRSVMVGGTLEQFAIQINALNRDNTLFAHTITMSWTGVRNGSEVTLLRGILSLLLVGERELSLQSTSITLTSQAPGDNFPGRLDVSLADQAAFIALDWYNMRVFRLADDLISLEFMDAPRGKTTRSGANLQIFEAFNDVIRIVYQPQEGVPGEQRLMLPAQDSYLEIVTPPGDPAFDGTALPDQAGFAARSLNNLGGECAPVTNILPQATCAPNGTPNAANGNLWLSLTDALAHGSQVDLALTRSYNSRGTAWTGPFGQGWTTDYLLDYDIAYNPDTNSRPVTADDNYQVALDVRYAPRGLLTYTSPSGSQHPFVLYNDGTRKTLGAPEEYRALTMPGWVITRAGLRSPWEMHHKDGLTYQFDRAGRLLRYGYPLLGRMIEIAYPRTTLNGPGSLGMSTPIFITDVSSGQAAPRRLELYYNADHFIMRSVLRDLTQGEPESLAVCDPAANCFETLYVYDQGRLAQILYSDGQLASYSYDEAGHLLQISDSRAPLAPQTSYTYSDGGDIASVTLGDGETSLLWRTLAYQDTADRREVVVTDELGNTRTYTYTRLPDSLRRDDTAWRAANASTYVLISETSPLNGTTSYESAPQLYTWENGLLTQVNTRSAGTQQGDGRLAYDLSYTPTGQLYCISCLYQGMPQMRVRFVDSADPRDTRVRPEDYVVKSITFADGSAITYDYDDRRLLQRMTDRTGASYVYTWSADTPAVLTSVTCTNDGTVWEYAYNDVGLLTKSVERQANEPAETAYTVSYTWDGLGRLTGVSDSQIGAYTMTYGLPLQASDGRYVTEMTLTDPIGAQTVRRYDMAGRLLESRLLDVRGLLRRETYTYDLLGRLTESARWIADDASGSRTLVTTYTYTPQDSIDVTGLTPEGGSVVIRGLRTDVIDAAGTQRTSIQDALGRLRETFDETQRRSYYDYTTTNSGRDYGLSIVQYEKLSGIATVNVNTFRFDSRWQLIGLERGTEKWDLFYENGTSTRVRALDSSVADRTVTLQEVAWNWAGSTFPQSVLLKQAPIDLNSRYTVDATHKPGLGFGFDFMGRPLQWVDGANNTSSIAYCPQPGGLLLTVYGQPNAPTVTCDSTDYQAAVVTDKHNRLIEYRDSAGTRTFTYYPDTVNEAEWAVDVTMTNTAGDAVSWFMRYNAAGDLIEWTDETSTVYSYTYDQLGRLTSVSVPDQPEKSFTFTYNDASRLTSLTDGLGRGTLYDYSDTEQVASALNARTADAVSFAYTPTGQLSAVVSAEGNATTFLYNDPTNPTRPTTIIDPTGNQHRYEWSDATNSLIYTNPLNQITRYRFDGTGLLWRIDDPLVVKPDAVRDTYRSHELHYDSAGHLTDWLFDVRSNAPAQQLLTIARDSRTWTVTEPQTQWSQTLELSPSGQLVRLGAANFTYDPLARLRQIVVGDQTWDLAWQSDAEVILSDPYGLKTVTRYDALYRAISETINDASTTYAYTPGSLSEVTLDVTRPGVGQRRYVMSPGNARSGTPPTMTLLAYGQQTQYIFNGEGLLVEILNEICTDATQTTLKGCTDANIPVWTTQLRFDYDADQRPIRVIDQDGRTRTFAYDDNDNLVTYQTASGRTYTYTYDVAQRLSSLTSATGVKLMFGYDTRDNLLGICRTRIDFAGDYTACTQQTTLAEGSGALESYAYDALDRLAHRLIPNLAATTDIPYEYSPTGQLTAIGGTRFTYNTLGLLESLDTGSGPYAFDYHALNQLADAGDLAFVYDDTGRVVGYSSGGQSFALSRDDANRYSLTNESTQDSIQYVLDDRGFLNGINYNGDNQVQLEYIYDAQEPGINLYWNSTEPTVITSTVNQAKETQSQQFDGAGYYTLFYDITPSGLVQRQDMTSLPGRDEGYIVVQGYDNDERPLTMRVTRVRNTDASDSQVLYTQTITYNTLGLRTGEQLQYADGTRVIKTLTYQNNSQLASLLVILIRPLPVTAALSLLPLLMLLRRRRGRVFIAGLLLSVAALPLLQAQTPQTEERYEYTYTYDAQGNVQEVALANPAQVCARYTYDTANRLTHVERGDYSASYAYDAYDRLTRIADPTGETSVSYQGTSGRILSVQGANQTYYLQTAGQPAFAALDASGAATWLITDGRERISQTYEDGDDPRKDLWLFDPLGRVLTLQPPAKDDDLTPCLLAGTRPVPERVRLQSDPKGMVWDAATGLYFFQGRAYDGDLGRYLQRDPRGPDALGNVYDGWTRQTVPLAQQDTPVYAEGLSILRDAMTTLHINDQLMAEAVKARYLPTGSRSISPVATMQQQSRQPFDQTVNGLAVLPLWLQSNYNLPAPGLDAAGHYTLSQAFAPGQSRTSTSFALPLTHDVPDWTALALQSVSQPADAFAALVQPVTQPLVPELNIYDAVTWRVQPVSERDFLQQPAPALTPGQMPESVLDLLPRTLAAPQQAAYTLDTVGFLYELAQRPTHEWVTQALAQALPTRPALPPQTLEEWEQQWFTEDAFGVTARTQDLKPALPFIPFYEWESSPDWLHILR